MFSEASKTHYKGKANITLKSALTEINAGEVILCEDDEQPLPDESLESSSPLASSQLLRDISPAVTPNATSHKIYPRRELFWKSRTQHGGKSLGDVSMDFSNFLRINTWHPPYSLLPRRWGSIQEEFLTDILGMPAKI